MKRDVLKAEYPLKHLLLVLEYNLFDPILSQCMDVFPQVVILVSLQIPEIFHLLLQRFDLLPQSLLYLSLPRGVRFRVSLHILLTNHGKPGFLECLTEIIDENLDPIESRIVLLREILHSIQLKQHFLDVAVLLAMLGVQVIDLPDKHSGNLFKSLSHRHVVLVCHLQYLLLNLFYFLVESAHSGHILLSYLQPRADSVNSLKHAGIFIPREPLHHDHFIL